MKRYLTCACCGDTAGRWEQWFNQDTGYGMCAKCIDWIRERGDSEDEISRNYGVEGTNWGREPAVDPTPSTPDDFIKPDGSFDVTPMNQGEPRAINAINAYIASIRGAA